jgi:carbon monoxide dehydrogenase subunit G
MRIEGTYQFDTPIDRVFAALTNPDALGAALPGCQRVIQLGPPDEAGQIHGEARFAFGPDATPSEMTWALDLTRIPRHLSLEARPGGAAPATSVRGFVDLVAREGQTVAAYVWDIEGAQVAHAATQPITAPAARAYLKRVGAALADQLAEHQPRATVADALPVLRADSARGRVTLLPAEPAQGPVMTRLRPVLNRGVWALAGAIAGVALLAALAATVGWLRQRNTSGMSYVTTSDTVSRLLH